MDRICDGIDRNDGICRMDRNDRICTIDRICDRICRNGRICRMDRIYWMDRMDGAFCE